jgi:uncharacterized Zn-binding protein involved in type VI secretion
METGPDPHIGGPIMGPGCLTVLIGGEPAACLGDEAMCIGAIDVIAEGSARVMIDNRPAAREGDLTAHGGEIALGFIPVMIDD